LRFLSKTLFSFKDRQIISITCEMIIFIKWYRSLFNSVPVSLSIYIYRIFALNRKDFKNKHSQHRE